MEYKVTLGIGRFVSFRERLLAGEETKILFDSSEYDISDLQVTITDGKTVKRFDVKDACFDITEFVTKACVLEITVDLILRGSVAKKWSLEPLVVRENGGQYYAIPEMELVRNELRRLKGAVKELNTKIQDTM